MTDELRDRLGPKTRFYLLTAASFFSPFCSAIAGGMAQAGGVVVPSWPVLLLGTILGVGSAWAYVKAYFSEPPG